MLQINAFNLILGCYLTCILCLLCRPVREYIDGSKCVACDPQCRPLNGSESCHGPVRNIDQSVIRLDRISNSLNLHLEFKSTCI